MKAYIDERRKATNILDSMGSRARHAARSIFTIKRDRTWGFYIQEGSSHGHSSAFSARRSSL